MNDFQYLKYLEQFKIIPNFWCSEEYFEKADLVEKRTAERIWIEDSSGMILFPILNLNLQSIDLDTFPKSGIWSDFDSAKYENRQRSFLDYEYVYDPKTFLNMKGSKWSVFRKNCKKFLKRLNRSWIYENAEWSNHKKLESLLLNWKSGEIQDSEVLIKYVLYGKNRKVLRDRYLIWGINIWDDNYYYINYRFCICRKEPFLSECMRWLFYKDMSDQSKLINDGGVLDNENLKKFKDKLNPIETKERYSII